MKNTKKEGKAPFADVEDVETLILDNEEPKAAYQEDAKNWGLKGDKDIVPVQLSDGSVVMRILWSKNLGLQLIDEKKLIKNMEHAQEMVPKMLKRNSIKIRYWRKVYFPKPNFTTGDDFEPDLVDW